MQWARTKVDRDVQPASGRMSVRLSQPHKVRGASAGRASGTDVSTDDVHEASASFEGLTSEDGKHRFVKLVKLQR